MNNLKFVTIFPDAENIHLVKDVGQIPFVMQNEFGWESTLVCHKSSSEYEYLDKETPGIQLVNMRKICKLFGVDLSVVWYILIHANKIDVLNIFHFNKASAIYSMIFKAINPSGLVYIKLDADVKQLVENEGLLKRGRGARRYVVDAIESFFIKYVNVFSVETDSTLQFIYSKYPGLVDKFVLIRNGSSAFNFKKNIKCKKRKLIITVGRIGTEQKNTEFLLDALKLVDINDWVVKIIGPIEKSFEDKITSFFESCPELKSAVEFTGPIYDRESLFQLYSEARIFCLTSKYEGFALVFSEALCFGNYIISTDVSGAADAVEGNKYGIVVPQNELIAYSKAIMDLIGDEDRLEIINNSIIENSKSKYSWVEILKVLDVRLRGMINA